MRNFLAVFFLVSVILFKVGLTEKKTDDRGKNSLELINSYPIDVPEPSGLAMAADNKSLYTVSDQTGTIYHLSLSGELLDSIIVDDGLDLEGVCFDSSGQFFLIVNERKGEILKINFDGEIISKTKIINNDNNKGLEGICREPVSGNSFVIKEKKPGLLIEVDEKFIILNKDEIDFAKDYSGLAWHCKQKILLIIIIRIMNPITQF